MPIASPSGDDNEREKDRAKVFFDGAKTVAGAGKLGYAIEMYIQGLNVDPENVDAHQVLRELSLKRTAGGGKDMGMFGKSKIARAKDEKQEMLNAEKLLAYSPGHIGRMHALLNAAQRAGMVETQAWIAAIMRRAANP